MGLFCLVFETWPIDRGMDNEWTKDRWSNWTMD